MPKSMWSMLVAGLAAVLVMVTQPAGAFSYECRGDAAKCPAPSCSGDQTACEVLQARQDGVDHDTGAHILFTFAVPAEHQPQTMELVLILGECPSSDDSRHNAGFRKGGSGSSVNKIMRHAVDAASDGLRLSGA
jgi:hypothetical protein